MKRIILIVALALSASQLVKAATIQSVTDGPFSSTATWDCSCVPTNSDDVVISTHTISTSSARTVRSLTLGNGSSFTVSGGTMVVRGTLDIGVGALLTNNSILDLRGHYVLNGTHAGNKSFKMSNTRSISGSGTFTNNKQIEILSGTRTVLAGSSLSFTSNTIQMKSTAELVNNGDLTIYYLRGNGANYVYNNGGASLEVRFQIQPGVELRFESPGNVVRYTMTGTSNQAINNPDFGFYDLELMGSSLNSVKRPFNDILILNDLSIMNCTFDLKKSSAIFNAEVRGDWNNQSGRFNPRTGTVTFSGVGNISNHTGTEEFYELFLSGATTLNCDVVTTSELFLTNLLLANGFDMYMEGDWTCVGDYVGGGGSVIFQGLNDSYVSGSTDFDDVNINKTAPAEVICTGPMNIYETLWMDNGTLTTNDNVYIASNAGRTGRLGEMGAATFNGDLRVERYMNFPANGWHLIGASVDNVSIAQWNNDFITTGFSGADWPAYAFCSITRYDETDPGHKDIGVYNISSTADAIPNGEGVRAYIAAGYNKLSIKGPAITGPFAWPVTYTPSGSPDDDGWNLLSNPYASTIDWDDTGNWTRSGVKDAVYVWVSEDEQYSSYIAGVGTNGGSRYIPSSQAFWVQTESAGPVLSITESAKADDDETFRNQDFTDYFKVIMTTSNGKVDEAAVRFDDNATMDFDSQLDAYELRSSNGNLPSIGLVTEDEKTASIYSLAHVNETTMIPLELHIGSDGEVMFQTQGAATQSHLFNVKLYDAQEQEYSNLRDVSAVSMELGSGDYSDRFYLVITPSTYVDHRSSELDDQQMWLADEILYISDVEKGEVDVEIYNALGQLLISESSVSLESLYRKDISQFEGLLIVDVIDRNSGERTSKRFVR